MKKALRILAIFFLLVLIFIGGLLAYLFISARIDSSRAMALAGDPAPTLTIDGHTFRDLNKNGALDMYEDDRLPVDARVADLLGQMNLEEKAGLLFHDMIAMNADGSLVESPIFSNMVSLIRGNNSDRVLRKKMNHFLL